MSACSLFYAQHWEHFLAYGRHLITILFVERLYVRMTSILCFFHGWNNPFIRILCCLLLSCSLRDTTLPYHSTISPVLFGADSFDNICWHFSSLLKFQFNIFPLLGFFYICSTFLFLKLLNWSFIFMDFRNAFNEEISFTFLCVYVCVCIFTYSSCG